MYSDQAKPIIFQYPHREIMDEERNGGECK
jgi:hypothetical protein